MTARTGARRTPRKRGLIQRVVRAGVPAEERPSTYWLLLGTTAVLLLVGLVMVLSASSVQSLREHGTTWYYFLRQGMWVSLGVVVFLVASRIDYRSLRKLATPFLGLAVSLPRCSSSCSFPASAYA